VTFQHMTAKEYRELIGAEDRKSNRVRLTVVVPYPPSTNELYRPRSTSERNRAVALGKKVRGKAKTDRYRTWIRAAQNGLTGQKLFMMPGAFSITLTHPLKRRKGGDLDNRIKAVLDFLQSQNLIENDKLCEGIVTHWSADIEHTLVHVIPDASTLEKDAA